MKRSSFPRVDSLEQAIRDMAAELAAKQPTESVLVERSFPGGKLRFFCEAVKITNVSVATKTTRKKKGRRMTGTPKVRQPQTPAEWQEGVNLAATFLRLEDAKAYGLAEGGPCVDVERCDELLALGIDQGIEPQEDAVNEMLRILAGGVKS